MNYTLKKHKRTKVLRIAVKVDGSVVVTVPYRLPNYFAKRFVESKKDWIEKRVAYFADIQKMREDAGLSKLMTGAEQKRDYINKKEKARIIITQRVVELNAKYNFTYKKIAIKNQKTRWGSCSRSGNLNFNYKIAYLTPEILDYVIIHELCHLKEFNHSKHFWSLVGLHCPNYRTIRSSMKPLGLILT